MFLFYLLGSAPGGMAVFQFDYHRRFVRMLSWEKYQIRVAIAGWKFPNQGIFIDGIVICQRDDTAEGIFIIVFQYGGICHVDHLNPFGNCLFIFIPGILKKVRAALRFGLKKKHNLLF